MNKINLAKKFELFDEYWTPKIIGDLNGQLVKIAKVKGEFVWHNHANEDEMFLIIKGTLRLVFRDNTIILKEGEMLIVPKGIEHKPIADEEVHLLLIEPKSTKHTGTVQHKLTKNSKDYI